MGDYKITVSGHLVISASDVEDAKNQAYEFLGLFEPHHGEIHLEADEYEKESKP